MKFLPSLFGTRRPVTQVKGAVDRRHSAGSYYSFEGVPTVSPAAGALEVETAVKDAWGRVIWVYRAIDARAKNASRLNVKIMDGRGPDAVEIPDHRLAYLLNRTANPYESGQAFRYRLHTLLDLSLRGVPVEVVEARNGTIDSLHILNPQITFPIPDPNRFLAGWEMRLPSGETMRLPVYERGNGGGVLWIRRPHPTDPYASSSWLQAAGISIDLDYYARVFNLRFLQNDGRPGGVLSVKGEDGLDPADAVELQRRMSGGPDSAGKVTILEAEHLEYMDLATNPRDAQYVESRALTQREILVAAGTPLSVIGDASGRTFDNADAEMESFWRIEMIPECDMVGSYWEELTDDGRGGDEEVVTYDYDSITVLQRDKRAREQAKQAEVAAGLATIDEYREVTNQEPFDLPGTRVLWAPAGKAPIGEDADVVALLSQGQAPPPPPGGDAGGAPALPPPPDGPVDGEVVDAGNPDQDAVPAVLDEAQYAEQKALPKDGPGEPADSLIEARRKAHAELIDAWEDALSKELIALCHRQEQVILARLKGAKARRHTRHWTGPVPEGREIKALDPAYIADRRTWIDHVVTAIASVVKAAFGAAGEATAKQLGSEWEPGKEAPEIIAKTVRAIAEGFDARAGRLQEIIEVADGNGDDIKTIAEKVRKAFISAPTWAAVSSRSVVGAMNAASLIAAVDAGALEKRWLATDDERTRPTHLKAEGQVVAIDEEFKVGKGTLDFPGDPTGPPAEWVNCRCTMLFALGARNDDEDLDEDLAALDEFEKAEWKAARAFRAFAGIDIRFDPSDHPRDYRGRFIDVPDVTLPDGTRGVAISQDERGNVTVAKADGDVVTTRPEALTQMATPVPTGPPTYEAWREGAAEGDLYQKDPATGGVTTVTLQDNGHAWSAWTADGAVRSGVAPDRYRAENRAKDALRRMTGTDRPTREVGDITAFNADGPLAQVVDVRHGVEFQVHVMDTRVISAAARETAAQDIDEVLARLPDLIPPTVEVAGNPDVFAVAGGWPRPRVELGAAYDSDTTVAQYAKQWGNGMSIAGGRDVRQTRRAVMVHEMGHNAMRQIEHLSEEARAEIDEFVHEPITWRSMGFAIGDNLDESRPRWVIDGLSTSDSPRHSQSVYATENDREWFAEAFADGYLNGDQASESGKRAYALARRHLGGDYDTREAQAVPDRQAAADAERHDYGLVSAPPPKATTVAVSPDWQRINPRPATTKNPWRDVDEIDADGLVLRPDENSLITITKGRVIPVPVRADIRGPDGKPKVYPPKQMWNWTATAGPGPDGLTPTESDEEESLNYAFSRAAKVYEELHIRAHPTPDTTGFDPAERIAHYRAATEALKPSRVPFFGRLPSGVQGGETPGTNGARARAGIMLAALGGSPGADEYLQRIYDENNLGGWLDESLDVQRVVTADNAARAAEGFIAAHIPEGSPDAKPYDERIDPNRYWSIYSRDHILALRDKEAYATRILESGVLDDSPEMRSAYTTVAWVMDFDHPGDHPEKWRAWWEQVGFTTDDEKVTKPTEPITVFRGALPSKKDGMSWTTDRQVAVHFAARHGGVDRGGSGEKMRLYTTTVPPDQVYAILNNLNESEVVVDTRGLDIVEVPFDYQTEYARLTGRVPDLVSAPLPPTWATRTDDDGQEYHAATLNGLSAIVDVSPTHEEGWRYALEDIAGREHHHSDGVYPTPQAAQAAAETRAQALRPGIVSAPPAADTPGWFKDVPEKRRQMVTAADIAGSGRRTTRVGLEGESQIRVRLKDGTVIDGIYTGDRNFWDSKKPHQILVKPTGAGRSKVIDDADIDTMWVDKGPSLGDLAGDAATMEVGGDYVFPADGDIVSAPPAPRKPKPGSRITWTHVNPDGTTERRTGEVWNAAPTAAGVDPYWVIDDATGRPVAVATAGKKPVYADGSGKREVPRPGYWTPRTVLTDRQYPSVKIEPGTFYSEQVDTSNTGGFTAAANAHLTVKEPSDIVSAPGVDMGSLFGGFDLSALKAVIDAMPDGPDKEGQQRLYDTLNRHDGFAAKGIEEQREITGDNAIKAAMEFHDARQDDPTLDPMRFWYSRDYPLHKRDLPAYAITVVNGGDLDDSKQGQDLLVSAWQTPEWPEGGPQMGAHWRAAFARVGFATDADDYDEPITQPTGPVTLYRGSTERGKRGMAWTTNFDTAAWFASRFGGGAGGRPKSVWTMTVDGSKVLAVLNGRGEHEYVTDTTGAKITRHPDFDPDKMYGPPPLDMGPVPPPTAPVAPTPTVVLPDETFDKVQAALASLPSGYEYRMFGRYVMNEDVRYEEVIAEYGWPTRMAAIDKALVANAKSISAPPTRHKNGAWIGQPIYVEKNGKASLTGYLIPQEAVDDGSWPGYSDAVDHPDYVEVVTPRGKPIKPDMVMTPKGSENASYIQATLLNNKDFLQHQMDGVRGALAGKVAPSLTPREGGPTAEEHAHLDTILDVGHAIYDNLPSIKAKSQDEAEYEALVQHVGSLKRQAIDLSDRLHTEYLRDTALDNLSPDDYTNLIRPTIPDIISERTPEQQQRMDDLATIHTIPYDWQTSAIMPLEAAGWAQAADRLNKFLETTEGWDAVDARRQMDDPTLPDIAANDWHTPDDLPMVYSVQRIGTQPEELIEAIAAFKQATEQLKDARIAYAVRRENRAAQIHAEVTAALAQIRGMGGTGLKVRPEQARVSKEYGPDPFRVGKNRALVYPDGLNPVLEGSNDAMTDDLSEEIKGYLESGSRVYPTDWVNAANTTHGGNLPGGGVVTSVSPRAYYSRLGNEISLSGHTEDYLHTTAVHEIGHAMETAIPGLEEFEWAMMWRRTHDLQPDGTWVRKPGEKYLNTAIAPGEYGIKDDWKNQYTGKVYAQADPESMPDSKAPKEMFTTIVQGLLGGDSPFEYGDDEMNAWAIGLLATLGTPERPELIPDAEPHITIVKDTHGGVYSMREMTNGQWAVVDSRLDIEAILNGEDRARKYLQDRKYGRGLFEAQEGETVPTVVSQTDEEQAASRARGRELLKDNLGLTDEEIDAWATTAQGPPVGDFTVVRRPVGLRPGTNTMRYQYDVLDADGKVVATHQSPNEARDWIAAEEAK